LFFIFGFLALFFAWATLFPISSAVVAGGKIVSSGQNKIVQHPIGGVVSDILVSEGERVKAGDLLVLLDKSAAQAELSTLLARHSLLNAQKSRYQSEQAGENVEADDQGDTLGSSSEDSSIAATSGNDDLLLNEQRREFQAGRNRLTAQADAIDFQIETLKDQKSGLQARIAGGKKLLEINSIEIGKVKPLVRDGLLAKSRLWDLEKVRLEQLTNIQNFESEIDAADQRISEAKANLAQLVQSDREQNSEEYTRVLAELAEIKDSIVASRRNLKLTELRAPVTGTIVKLSTFTKGGVVRSADEIAEIVPDDARLEVEFRVRLDKITSVTVDQKARIRITAFNARTYDQIEGKVTFVSADSFIDDATGEPYFLARAVMMDNPEKNTGLKEVSAGMSTEVYVLSEPRVFGTYLVQPIVDSFNKAFREG